VTDDYLSSTQAAQQAACTPRAINKACANGRLPSLMVGATRIIKRADLEAWIQKRKGEEVKG
jgi:excisionase family DNA binding protein